MSESTGQPPRLRVHEHQIEIAASAADVWRALTGATEIARWVGWDADHMPAWIDATFVRNVRSSDPQKYLLLGDRSRHFIEFFVESRGRTTRIRLVHSGELEGSDWDAIYDSEYAGWRGYLHCLRHGLERHPGIPRRAFHFGVDTDLDPEVAFSKLLYALDPSGELAARAEGEPFSCVTAGGDPLAGVIIAHPPGATAVTLVVQNLNDALISAGASRTRLVEGDERGVATRDRSTHAAPRGAAPRSGIGLILSAWGVPDTEYEYARASFLAFLESMFPRDA